MKRVEVKIVALVQDDWIDKVPGIQVLHAPTDFWRSTLGLRWDELISMTSVTTTPLKEVDKHGN